MSEPDKTPASMILVRIGDKTYPAKTSGNCRTCQHPRRASIEAWYLSGWRWAAIMRELDGQPSPLGELTEKSLRHHFDAHLPIEARSQAAIIERRAKQIGDAIDELADRVADEKTALELTIAKGFDDLAAGKLKMSLADLLNAIKLKHQMDQSVGDGLDTETWRRALMVHMEIAIQFIPPNQRQAFARALSENPILRALAEAQRQPKELPA